ncbi:MULTISPECIES: hypothetical protein [unclassified Mycoplasma]|uniref:hypothetical protein n=1 Tax=unclassified Mycoplasma TaxID=2683645 RepID=UPI00216AEB90|nr:MULTISPECIES: hypothetical protein [unclassified Mycoplasma]MCS4536911.1 hypothetical protein [Mycoplasma sp. CSL7475-4]MCT4469441.1 hypothetical protein [Mycoplasma sp. HS2188]
MKYNIKKIPIKEQAKIYGGSALSAFTAIAPIVISGFSAIANVIRMFTSKSGESKTGTNSIKWNNEPGKAVENSITKTKSIYLSY